MVTTSLNVSRKISKSIGIIYKSSFYLSAVSLRTLYFSLAYPYLIYCITVWGSTDQTNLKRMITLQKKVIRIISNVLFDAHTDNLFRDHQIWKFTDIYLFQTTKFMFLYTKDLLPNSFNNTFTLTNQIHSYNTRNSNCFYIFPCWTNIRRFSIRFRGPLSYNSLNQEIRIVTVFVCLVNCLKNPYCKIRLTLSCCLFRFTLCLCLYTVPVAAFLYEYASNMISSVFLCRQYSRGF